MSFEIEKGSASKTNQHGRATLCTTCGGDRFVVVRTRPVEQTPWMRAKGITPPKASIDEYAPCPECHSSLDTHFMRQDGSKFTTPDPEQTRRYLNG